MAKANITELFEGMESYMEDIDIDVNVGTDEAPAEPEEVVEATETAAEEQGEVEEADAEAETTENAAEEMFARFDDVDRMMQHVETYGVDRSFLSLMNYNDRLSRSFDITLPSCESFDAVGSPKSPESIACMEGLKEIASKIWEFIKKVCSKIASLVSRIFEAVRVRVGSLDGNIGRLRRLLEDRSDIDASDAKKIKVKIIKQGEGKDMAAAVGQAFAKASEKVADVAKNLKDISVEGALRTQRATRFATGGDDEKMKQFNKFWDAFDKKFAKNISKLLEGKETDVVNATSRAEAMLNEASDLKKTIDTNNTEYRKQKFAADEGVKLAEGMLKRDADDADAKAMKKEAQKDVKDLNKVNSRSSKMLSTCLKYCGGLVKGASVLINRGTKKA